MSVFGWQCDDEFFRGEGAAMDALDLDAHLRERGDGGGARLQGFERRARIEERGNQHVARRTRERIDDETLLQRASFSMRAASSRALATTMAAAQPAPKPLSMLTTVTPEAQLVIMPRS